MSRNEPETQFPARGIRLISGFQMAQPRRVLEGDNTAMIVRIAGLAPKEIGRLIPLAAMLSALFVASATLRVEADEPRLWKLKPGTWSANLARSSHWELVTSSGLSWPDGRQAIITFWRQKQSSSGQTSMLRCVDYFDLSMRAARGTCYEAR